MRFFRTCLTVASWSGGKDDARNPIGSGTLVDSDGNTYLCTMNHGVIEGSFLYIQHGGLTRKASICPDGKCLIRVNYDEFGERKSTFIDFFENGCKQSSAYGMTKSNLDIQMFVASIYISF